MADITLHSGSFCDRNNNEISITFFKRTSTPVMTVDPTALSFTSNGGTKQLRVSNYTGTLSISVTGGTGWLSRTQSTSSGVRTYTFTATANTATTMRNATITLTDSNSTVTVGVTQAGAVSNVTVNPNYLVFNSRGETKTTTVTWAGGTTPTWSNAPEWASITSSVSGGTMTLTINVGVNTTQYQRTGTVYVSNGISRADLALEQSATHTVSVSPSSFTFTAAGGTQELTITNIEGSFSMNYQGDFLTLEPTYTSSTIRKYNVICSANPVRAQRTGVINVKDTAGDWVAVPVTQAASTESFAVSPTSFEYAGSGSTNTFTFTGSPSVIAYNIPEGVDWVTVSNLSTSSVDITTSANQTPNSRTTTVMFYNDFDMSERVFVTVNQAEGVDSLTVVPYSITFMSYGSTEGVTATWTAGDEPTMTITYVEGASGWITMNGQGTVTGNVKEWSFTASPNTTGNSRTAIIRVTNGLQTAPVSIVQAAMPPVFAVSPTSFEYPGPGMTNQFEFSNAPASLSYELEQGVDWVTVSNLTTSGVDITAAENDTINPRTTTVKIYNTNDVTEYVTITVNQEENVSSLEVVPYSINFMSRGGTEGITATWSGGTEPTYTITYVEGASGWITPIGQGTVTGNVKEWAFTAAPNNTGNSRTGIIRVTNGIQTAQVPFNQSAVRKMTADPSSLNYTYLGGSKTVTITKWSSQATVACTNNTNWLTVTLTVVSGGRVDATVVANTNDTSDQKTATLRFYDTGNVGDYVDVPVTQAANDEVTLDVTPASLSFNGGPGMSVITATYANAANVFASTSNSWITLSNSTSSTGSKSFTVSVDPNFTSTSRSGNINVMTSGETVGSEHATQDVPVTQAVAAEADPQFTVSPSEVWYTKKGYPSPNYITIASVPAAGLGWSYDGPSDVTYASVDGSRFYSNLGTNTSSSYKNGTFYLYDKNDVTNRVTIAAKQVGNTSYNVEPSSLSFTSASGTGYFVATDLSATYATISYSGSVTGWISDLLIHSGDGGTGNFKVAANTGVQRSATINFKNGGVTYDTLVVTQDGVPQIDVEPDRWEFDSLSGEMTFGFYNVPDAGIGYTIDYVNGTSGWITVTVNNDGYANVAVSANYGIARAATITFYDLNNNTNSCTANITQQG